MANTASTRCKGQDQHQRKWKRDAATTCTTADQLRISTGAGEVHDAAIIATCMCKGTIYIPFMPCPCVVGHTHARTHTHLHRYFYTTTQQMPVAKTQEHTVSGDRPPCPKSDSSHLSWGLRSCSLERAVAAPILTAIAQVNHARTASRPQNFSNLMVRDRGLSPTSVEWLSHIRSDH